MVSLRNVNTKHIIHAKKVLKHSVVNHSTLFHSKIKEKISTIHSNYRLLQTAILTSNKCILSIALTGNPQSLPLYNRSFLSGKPLKTRFCNIRVSQQWKPLIMFNRLTLKLVPQFLNSFRQNVVVRNLNLIQVYIRMATEKCNPSVRIIFVSKKINYSVKTCQ